MSPQSTPTLDIVERMRAPKYECSWEAADEIERLRAVEVAARAVLNGDFEREDTEYADALFSCLEDALNGVDHGGL